MPKQKLVYIWSLRNAAADKAGQFIDYKGTRRYMASPLEHLCSALDTSELGEAYDLAAIIHDDDPGSAGDVAKLADYGFAPGDGPHWFHPPALTVQGRRVDDLKCGVPSTYRRLPLASPERPAGKRAFERALLDRLVALDADLVLLDGLLIILDELVRPGAPFHRRIVNIHPGVTRAESPYERRGACATLDALHGARGQRIDWRTLQATEVSPLFKTGASFHYVDNGIDSGEVIEDVLATDIAPEDTILELRWNNFNLSLFPAMTKGLATLARRREAA